MRAKSVQGFKAKARGIAGTGAHYNARGIVAVTDMMVFTQPFDDLQIYRSAEKQGLRQQAPLYFTWAELERNPIPDLTDKQRKGRTKFAGIKLFADGSISGRTAWVSEAYRNSDEHGFPTLPKQRWGPRTSGRSATRCRSRSTRWATGHSNAPSTSFPTRSHGWAITSRPFALST